MRAVLGFQGFRSSGGMYGLGLSVEDLGPRTEARFVGFRTSGF